MIRLGIDEAGYGPILGPLAVGGAAVRTGGEALRVRTVRLADSKSLHRPAAGPGPLEREVLAVLAARDGRIPRDGAALHAALGVPPPPADHPWYADLASLPLPLAADAGEAEERGAALARELRGQGAALLLLRVRVLPEGRFNEAVAREGSKAAVLFGEAAAILEEGLAAAGGGPLDALCDRQGGRTRYGTLLQERFPGRLVAILEETRRRSAYGLGAGARVRFEVEADAADPLPGLASMLAKYLREVWMGALNAWVLREAPGVRPTAGYWTDGLRFLRETAEARRRRGVEEGLFVRAR